LHRVLFFNGHWYAIYSYGFMLVVAMLAGLAVNRHRARRRGIDPDAITDLTLTILVGALVMARLLEVVEDWPAYAGNPIQILNLRGGGLSWHGGILGGLLGFAWYVRRSGLPSARCLDIITPGVIVGHMLGRIGCFLNGCCYGRPCSLPWGLVFTDAPETRFIPRHPTQLYEVASEAILLGLVLIWERVGGERTRGTLAWLYLGFYGLERFIIEFYRDEPVVCAGLTYGQWFSILLIAAGVAVFTQTLRRHAPPADTPLTDVPLGPEPSRETVEPPAPHETEDARGAERIGIIEA
jgi:phosphatidylglycerol---prolipoprotein diacylglyceryl transferase